MTSEEYENLVAEITNGIKQQHGDLSDMTLGFGRANKIMGTSGYKHQIDVSLQCLNLLFIIECKKWHKRIGPSEVLVLSGRKMDIETEGCKVVSILTSMKGATEGANELARHFGVALEIVTSAHEFGLRIGSFIHQAVENNARFSDVVTPTVIRNGQVV